MKTLKIIAFLIFNSSLLMNAQEKVIPKFKKIEYASYYVNPSQKEKVELSSYSIIDQNGLVIVHLNGNRGLKFYSYQLSDTIIKELNDLLVGKNPLKKNMIETQMKPGRYYGGNYDFISYQTKSEKETLCFVEPYMSQNFNFAYKKFRTIILSQLEKAQTSDPKFDIKKLEKRILDEHNKSDYLPLRQMPPPPKRK